MCELSFLKVIIILCLAAGKVTSEANLCLRLGKNNCELQCIKGVKGRDNQAYELTLLNPLRDYQRMYTKYTKF